MNVRRVFRSGRSLSLYEIVFSWKPERDVQNSRSDESLMYVAARIGTKALAALPASAYFKHGFYHRPKKRNQQLTDRPFTEQSDCPPSLIPGWRSATGQEILHRAVQTDGLSGPERWRPASGKY